MQSRRPDVLQRAGIPLGDDHPGELPRICQLPSDCLAYLPSPEYGDDHDGSERDCTLYNVRPSSMIQAHARKRSHGPLQVVWHVTSHLEVGHVLQWSIIVHRLYARSVSSCTF